MNTEADDTRPIYNGQRIGRKGYSAAQQEALAEFKAMVRDNPGSEAWLEVALLKGFNAGAAWQAAHPDDTGQTFLNQEGTK